MLSLGIKEGGDRLSSVFFLLNHFLYRLWSRSKERLQAWPRGVMVINLPLSHLPRHIKRCSGSLKALEVVPSIQCVKMTLPSHNIIEVTQPVNTTTVKRDGCLKFLSFAKEPTYLRPPVKATIVSLRILHSKNPTQTVDWIRSNETRRCTLRTERPQLIHYLS